MILFSKWNARSVKFSARQRSIKRLSHQSINWRNALKRRDHPLQLKGRNKPCVIVLIVKESTLWHGIGSMSNVRGVALYQCVIAKDSLPSDWI